ncbi:flagellar protein FlgN [Agarivorans sp. TSD2052]|uniref:flagellar export chaperone FlgN n=1 Tax=Agarivorans sp. TSD2052 TaxID=2937286 RepID=UPI00200F2365|nr:flagellar export chaperone FlgN [Agarivorans sp. TSD2052]UPW20139.1 flagellar protein FlgN [Agarivorans sp. TSD2052]
MIADLLNTQEQQLRLLLSLLQKETKALESDDAISLYAIASEKEQTLETIAKLDQELETSADKQQLGSAPLKQQVDAIKQLLEQCQQLNALNGEIIQASNEKIRQLSQVIEQLKNQNSATYDKLGKKHGAHRVGKGFKA